MTALYTVNNGDTVLDEDVNQLVGALLGTAGRGQPIALTALTTASTPSGATNWALTVKNQGTSGQALRVQNSSGTNLLTVNDVGINILPSTPGTARLVVGDGDYHAGIDAQIEAAGLAAFLDGSDGSPSSVAGPAVTISKVAGTGIRDGVGTVLSLYGVRAFNDQSDTEAPPGDSMDVLSLWGVQSSAGQGNISGVYSRVAGAYPNTYSVEASVTAAVNAGAITTLTLNSGGSGYTGPATVIFHGGSATAHGTATATMSGGAVTAITKTSSGSGYASAPTVRVVPAAGSIFGMVAYANKQGTNTQYQETIGIELNPDNRSSADGSPDYAFGGLYDVRVGRDIGVNVVHTGTQKATVAVNIDRHNVGGEWFTGIDFQAGSINTGDAVHAANISGNAIRIPNETWITARSLLTTAGADTLTEPKMPLTVPLLKLNNGDNTVLNSDTGHVIVFSNGRPTNTGGGPLTTLATMSTALFTVGTSSSLDTANSLNVDQSGLAVGVGGVVPTVSLDVVDSGAVPVLVTQYGASNGGVAVRTAAGTQGSPTSISSADTNIGTFTARAYTSASAFTSDIGGMIIRSAEAITGTNQGTYIMFSTVPTGGSTTLTERVRIKAGMDVGGATGGDKGSGTINCAGDIYKNNTAFTNPDFVFEHAYRGDIVQFADSPGADTYPGLMSLEATEAYARKHWQLPRVAEASGIFSRSDIILEKIEELYLHLFAIQHRLKSVELR